MLTPKQWLMLIGLTIVLWAIMVLVWVAIANANVERLAGPDRYTTSVQVSRTGWPNGSDVVYVASGEQGNLVDSITAPPIASLSDAPLLLVPGQATTIPEAVGNELARLSPSRIVIVGGTAAVSDHMASLLATYVVVVAEPQAYGLPLSIGFGAPYDLPLTYSDKRLVPSAEAFNEWADTTVFKHTTVDAEISLIEDNEFPDTYRAYVRRHVERCDIYSLEFDSLSIAILAHELTHCLGYMDSIPSVDYVTGSDKSVCDDTTHSKYSRYAGHMSYCVFNGLGSQQMNLHDRCSMELAGYLVRMLANCELG